ncbi:phage tail assembly chaperone [Pseudorhodobacter turbinis]|uniref:Phage tail assembly chaperone n=1 Tax=Pseudorhodobacter turbinis TaxID=2500533 RepID=A0A4P8ED15_9RHOB|nr:rcc01693 family protein [Pseudorhodobacter turbinis]QCO54608.1 phage tail assembly chaperone [Pseudorhodobacter turbinis]
MTGIDWAGLMQVGLHGLGMQPQDFWRLTPVELRIKLGAAASAAPLTRARLEDLARAFPDVKKETEHG